MFAFLWFAFNCGLLGQCDIIPKFEFPVVPIVELPGYTIQNVTLAALRDGYYGWIDNGARYCVTIQFNISGVGLYFTPEHGTSRFVSTDDLEAFLHLPPRKTYAELVAEIDMYNRQLDALLREFKTGMSDEAVEKYNRKHSDNVRQYQDAIFVYFLWVCLACLVAYLMYNFGLLHRMLRAYVNAISIKD